MELTRRRFLECAAGAAGSALAMALPAELAAFEHRSPHVEPAAHCALLDLGEHCCLHESLAGYESALVALGASWMRSDARSLPRCALLIVPAALRISPSVARQLTVRVREGATVVLESGAGFCAADSADFVAHRDVLREQLQLYVEPPVSLWPRSVALRGLPYVDYSWPAAASVRDFSRVVPLGGWKADDAIIGRTDGLPVALRRRVGPGALLFLGSPLGPTLGAGDHDARRWLAGVVASGR